MAFQETRVFSVFRSMPRKRVGKEGGEGGSGAQKRGPVPSPPDAVGANKKTVLCSQKYDLNWGL